MRDGTEATRIMSPLAILNPTLYADRTVQDWHRRTFPGDWGAIDLDLLGYCPQCYRGLYLIESTTNPEKYTSVLRRLARDSGVPALLVIHNCQQPTHGRWLFPAPAHAIDSTEALISVLSQIRREHECE